MAETNTKLKPHSRSRQRLFDVHLCAKGHPNWDKDNSWGLQPLLHEDPYEYVATRLEKTEEMETACGVPVDMMFTIPFGVRSYYQGFRNDGNRVWGYYANPVDVMTRRMEPWAGWSAAFIRALVTLQAYRPDRRVILYSGSLDTEGTTDISTAVNFYKDRGFYFGGDATAPVSTGRGAEFMQGLKDEGLLAYTEAIPKEGNLPEWQRDVPHLVQPTRWEHVSRNPEKFETGGKPGSLWLHGPNLDYLFPDLPRSAATIAILDWTIGWHGGSEHPHHPAANLVSFGHGYSYVKDTPYAPQFAKLAKKFGALT